jgi:hypothetical protein
MNRFLSAACAATLCALVMAASATAEVPSYSGEWPEITSPESPEDYTYRVELSPSQELVQLTPTEVGVEYPSYGVTSFILYAGEAHDSNGVSVPVTLAMTGADLVTRTVHHREGNPAAGFAPFQYPILQGPGWEGGFHTFTTELNEPKPPATQPSAAPAVPTPVCTVPALHGYGLVAAKKLLRGADCGVGKVRLAHGATKGAGKVVKQFEPAGTQLAAGAPVAVKLAAR